MEEFITIVEESKSLYGLKSEIVDSRIKSDTLDSLILDMLPPLGHEYMEVKESREVCDEQDVCFYLLLEILNSLRNNAGFHIPEVRHIEFSYFQAVSS